MSTLVEWLRSKIRRLGQSREDEDGEERGGVLLERHRNSEFWIFDRSKKMRKIVLEDIERVLMEEGYMCECRLIGSCNGLVMFVNLFGKVLIINPITQEQRLVPRPPTNCHSKNGYLCAIYFDRFDNDYKLLHALPEGDLTRYHIFSFTKNAWGTIRSTRSTQGGPPPHEFTSPAIVEDALHWVGKFAITQHYGTSVVFDVKKKGIRYLPLPSSVVNSKRAYSMRALGLGTNYDLMRLIEKSGQLCLCETNLKKGVIDMWILEDYGNWDSWVRKHEIDLSWVIPKNPSYAEAENFWMVNSMEYTMVKVLGMLGKDGVLLNSDTKGLYLYHLGTHTKRQIKNPCNKKITNSKFSGVPFTQTLINPNNVVRV